MLLIIEMTLGRFITELLSLILAFLGCRREDLSRPGTTPYLTRWHLLGGSRRGRRVYLHWFHRGDIDEVRHDHPWKFCSLILWGGYWEQTRSGTRWYWPGSILLRPAAWSHRIIVPDGKSCWTLIFVGPKEREWGFSCTDGWRPWRKFIDDVNAGGTGCG